MSLLGKARPLLPRLDTRPARFVLVGLTGICVNTAVLWLGTRVFGVSVVVGGAAAAVISTFTNFLLNDAFTWRDRHVASLRVKAVRLVRYYSTTAGGNVVYLSTLTVLTHWLGVPLVAANLIAIGIGGTLNYLVHNVWTWRSEYG